MFKFESNPHPESWAQKTYVASSPHNIPLSRPSYLPYIDEVLQATEKVLRSGFIAQGEVVAEFEQRIANYCGTKYGIAVSSGTAGLFLCLKAVGIGQGDEVITTPYTFIATVFAIQQAGAVPVFCDVDRETYNMDLSKFGWYVHRNIKAYMPVDIFGLPYDTSNIKGFPVIADSCESLGNHPERPFTTQVFGLYPNKLITTGEGGVICTDNKKIADYCKAYRNQGRSPGDTWLDSSQDGFNYRMTDIQAAIGIVQMKHIDEIIHRRKRVIQRYNDNGIYLSQRIDTDKYNPFLFVIECDNRDKVMQHLLSHGVECRAYFPAIHLMKCMSGYKKGDFPIAEEIASRTLALPFWSDISESEIETVCKILREVVKLVL
ncbi:MAG: DegT/DnrJ/EryC1/StrS family aminotransferase [Candidatus Babeliales bacterium]|jgi:perosamine synthetase